MSALPSRPDATGADRPLEIARERLDRRLDEVVAAMPLTVVTGPAGTGKTMLLSAFARRSGAAWITVRRDHADPTRLWRDVAFALSATGIDAATARPAVAASEVVRAIGDAVAGGAPPPTLVLDDLDHGGALAADVVATLVDCLPFAVHLVVAARAEPALALPRRRVAGEVAELRARDLAFTPDEAAALLHAAGLELQDEQTARLVARTEGWAAGLRLAALALRRGEDPERFLAEFAGDDWAVADYLVGELLEALDDDARELLVRTSVVDRVTGPLADALTGGGDGEERLRDLERSGCLIVPLDEHGHWFRYHALLLELLRSRLAQRGPDAVRDLHARAAEWLVEQGHGAEAVRHLVAAREPEQIARLLGDRWVDLLLDPPPRGALVDADGQLPGDGRVVVAAAAACLDAGEPADAVRALTRVDHGPSLVTAMAALLQARADGDADAARAASRILERPGSEGETRWRLDDQLRLLTRFHVGMTEFAAGERAAAQATLDGAIVLARELGHHRPLVDALARSAAVALLDGRIGRAEAEAQAAVALLDAHRGARAAAAWAYATLAAVAFLRDEPASAQGFVDVGTSAAHTARDAVAAAALRGVRGHLHVAGGDRGEGAMLLRSVADEAVEAPLLASWLAALGPRPVSSDDPLATPLDEALARLTGGDALSAARRADPLLDPLCGLHLVERIHAQLVAAAARQAVGQPRLAERALEAALELAAAERVWQPFLARGPAIRRQLAHHAESPSPHAPAAGELLGRFVRAQGPGSADLEEELSERERQVLRLLPTLMSSTEMGAELYVSVNTVKTHTRSIYRKLGVSSRRAAVVRAQQLGLL